MHLHPTHADPVKAAAALCDRHVVSQIGEATQVCEGALKILGGFPVSSQPAWIRWAAAAPVNFSWAWLYLDACHREYNRRHGKLHGQAAMAQKMTDQHPEGNKIRGLALFEEPASWPRSKAARLHLEHLGDQEAAQDVLRTRYQVWTARGQAPVWTKCSAPEWL